MAATASSSGSAAGPLPSSVGVLVVGAGPTGLGAASRLHMVS